MIRRLVGAVAVVALAASGCGDDGSGTEDGSDGLFPDVVSARVEPETDGTFAVEVTMSSPYDTPERYADAWRVIAPDGTVLGVRELAHDHAGEQPFTRRLAGVEIPSDVEAVTIEGRDQVNGWGGATVVVEVGEGQGDGR